MALQSVYPPLDIPQTNVLSYLFPPNQPISDKPIWIDAANPAHSLSPRQIHSWVRRLGYGLDRLGVPRGAVVMILTPNHIYVPIAYQGIVGAGRIFSGANPIYTESEVEYQMRNTTASLVLVHPSLVHTALAAGQRAGVSPNRMFLFSDDTPSTPIDGVHDWREMVGTEEEGASWHWDQMGDRAKTTVATVNYSSGTTGLPKGVCISHANLIANVEQNIFMRDQGTPFNSSTSPSASRPEERWLGFLPLYHAYGQLFACLVAPKLGFPVYIMRQFVFEDFLAAIQTYRITHLQVAPPILIMLDKRPETVRYDLSSIEAILCGAAPLSRDLQNSVQRRFGLRVVQAYGMTELTCGVIHVPGGASDETGSVGLLDPNCECQLVAPDGSIITYPGEPGEVYIRGPNVCLGYWRNEPATRETISPDGWLKTGDVMVVKDGWFWVVDRKKELIKVNGLQVAPAELEAVLLEHDDIADAGVVGVPFGDGEERPRAYVLPKEGRNLREDQIEGFLRQRVAKHKWLVGGVVIVGEIPRLASGKIQRAVLRKGASKTGVSKL